MDIAVECRNSAARRRAPRTRSMARYEQMGPDLAPGALEFFPAEEVPNHAPTTTEASITARILMGGTTFFLRRER